MMIILVLIRHAIGDSGSEVQAAVTDPWTRLRTPSTRKDTLGHDAGGAVNSAKHG